MGTRREGDASFHADREQVEAVNRYAHLRGARVVFMEPELSVSGGKEIEKRPSLVRAIEGCESGEFQGIVVAYLSRLTRSRSGLAIWTRVEAAGGSVHSAAEELDTSTPNGRFIRDIHLANAVREREEAGEGHRRRKERATADGVWQRRQTPRGYGKDPDTRRLVPDRDEGLIRDVFRERAAGATLGELAARLGMTPGGAGHLLKNRVYLGELRVGEFVNEAAHPAIIPADLFDVVQGTRGVRPARSRIAEASFATSLLRCEACGFRMSRGNTGSYAAFACRAIHSGGKCPAPASLSVRRTERMLDAIARHQLSGVRLRPARREGEIARARQRVEAARSELDAYLVAVTAAGLEPGEFAAGLQSRRDELRAAEAALSTLEQLTTDTALGGQAALKAWEDGDAARRGVIIRALVETVVVRASGRGNVLPLDERVRVIAHGTGLDLGERHGAAPMGLRRLQWPDLSSPHVLWVVGLQ